MSAFTQQMALGSSFSDGILAFKTLDGVEQQWHFYLEFLRSFEA